MTQRTSSAEWKGTLKDGGGTMSLGSGAYTGPYTFASRFESGPGTNPEELVGAAHAGCYSMFLSALLTNAGFKPDTIRTTATVRLGDGPTIHLIKSGPKRSGRRCRPGTGREKGSMSWRRPHFQSPNHPFSRAVEKR